MKKEYHYVSGMLVVCLASSGGGFHEGHVYKVLSEYGDTLGIERDSDGDANGWVKGNFRPITGEELECLILSCEKVPCQLPGSVFEVIVSNINRELNEY